MLVLMGIGVILIVWNFLRPSDRPQHGRDGPGSG